METTAEKILEDERPIVALEFASIEGIERFEVDPTKPGKIIPYGEPGEYCDRVWFKLCGANGVVHRRVNGAFVATITYGAKKPKPVKKAAANG